MIGRTVSFVSTLALLGMPLAAEGPASIRFEPGAPDSSQTVRADVTYETNCFDHSEVTLPPAGTASPIRITAIEGCVCPANLPSPFTFSAQLGALPAGLYPVEFHVRSSLPCTPVPRLGTKAWLQVAEPGQLPIMTLRPPFPNDEDLVGLTVKTTCPLVFRNPEIVDGSGERLVLIRVDSTVPPPLGPCFTYPVWDSHFALAELKAGTYRVQLLGPAPDNGEVIFGETTFTVTPASGPLVLHGGSFEVEATWTDGKGKSGVARPVALTSETGYFWFFGPDNVELFAKVLNGCAVNNRWWVFLAGLTDVKVEVSVTETIHGKKKTYTSKAGKPFQPVLDTAAFAVCD